MTNVYSIIVPSFLGSYQYAASHREDKFIRAINSIFTQTYRLFEVIVIADGCQRTVELIEDNFNENRLSVHYIEKQKKWSGNVRNAGIDRASGDYCVYLDTDDIVGENHLSKINTGIVNAGSPKAVFFDDWIAEKKLGETIFCRRICMEDVKYRNGTSNIAHTSKTSVRWKDGYLHDYIFIQDIKAAHGLKRINAGEYFVCHVPKGIDV